MNGQRGSDRCATETVTQQQRYHRNNHVVSFHYTRPRINRRRRHCPWDALKWIIKIANQLPLVLGSYNQSHGLWIQLVLPGPPFNFQKYHRWNITSIWFVGRVQSAIPKNPNQRVRGLLIQPRKSWNLNSSIHISFIFHHWEKAPCCQARCIDWSPISVCK